MARKSKKELEEILLSLGITDPLSKLSKSALMDLVNKEISGGLSI